MQLWNDYEGKIIAGKYPLGPLVRPEGRSALFQLSAGVEAPAIIRLTEAINDEGQMLACWTRVAAVKQENLVAIKRFGETNFEGTPLTYAVMEPTDANLADLLKERPLTHSEAMQVATSVVAALTALHAKNLVHEHIDAAAILAVGETVKLRTDCVRECVVEPGFTTAEDCLKVMERDVHDLAELLLRALTLDKKLRPSTKLPAPFDRIVPNGMNGAWGLREIAAALVPPAAVVHPALSQAATTTLTNPAPSHPAAAAGDESLPDTPLLYRRRNHVGTLPVRQRGPLWVAAAIVAVIALGVFLREGISAPAKEPQIAAAPAVAAAPVRQAVVKVAPAPAPTPPAPAPPIAQTITATRMQPGWYVVAYTFNRQQQAATRAAAIAQKNPSLHPAIIAPGGHAPFLVAIGGAMSRPEAETARNLARQAGMPRDTFIQNYKGN
jgi:eukaryotic-like serine/threonine-protein kinase